jgi:aminoglycoside phosphotransferase (APT) family kinase protein
MNDPWVPDREVSAEEVRALVASQFPEFANSTFERYGAGWDNVAYLVDGRFIFRFPQRQLASGLIDREITYLPAIAPQVPVRTTNPQFVGVAANNYPWRFAGYERLPGDTACARELSPVDRGVLAEDLAHFLRALHSIDATQFQPPLPHDDIGKLDPNRLQVDEEPLIGAHTVVHGDLYARHLILDEANRLAGVIDWGDLHYGNPAVDLSVVHMMIPSRYFGRFLDIYGEVDERTWRFARHRARHHATYCLDYATKESDPDLLRAAQTALRYVNDHG